MFALAYVILPFSDVPPADAIAASMARFERGKRGDVPDEWLRFFNETAELREEYEREYVFTLGQGLRTEGGDRWHIDARAIIDEMKTSGRDRWQVRFAGVEPDFDRFVERFAARPIERHEVTGGYGRWLNGLGRWDYWELGGRFDGRIIGQRPVEGRRHARIGSGPNAVRDAVGAIERGLDDALDQQLDGEGRDRERRERRTGVAAP